MAKLSSFLLELEERFAGAAIIELQHQLATHPFPRLLRHPSEMFVRRGRQRGRKVQVKTDSTCTASPF